MYMEGFISLKPMRKSHKNLTNLTNKDDHVRRTESKLVTMQEILKSIGF